MSSQPSLFRSAMAGPYDQPTSATWSSRPIRSNFRPPRLWCIWLPVVNERSLAITDSEYVPGQRLAMIRLPAFEYMLADVKIDMAVVVEVAGRDPHRAVVARAAVDRLLSECPIPPIDEQDAVAELVDDVEIGPVVVVGIEPDRGEGGAVAARCIAGPRDVGELPVPQVPPEPVGHLAAPLAVDPAPGPQLARARHEQV